MLLELRQTVYLLLKYTPDFSGFASIYTEATENCMFQDWMSTVFANKHLDIVDCI